MKQLLASLFLVTSSFTSISGLTSQTEKKPALERTFQEAVDQRTNPFVSWYTDEKHLLYIEMLLSNGRVDAEQKGAALANAVSYGDIELLQLLLRYGADANYQGENGRTVLMIAAAEGFYSQCGNDPSINTYTGNTAAVKALLDAGSRIDTQNSEGNTALMLAAQHARSESVKLLLLSGANVNLTNAHGETALMYATEAAGAYAEDNVNEIVKGLISSGADLNVRDEQGNTALTHANRSSAVKRILIAAGAIE